MHNNKLTVATIFVDLENIHLIKDPGMIPFSLHKYFGYKAIIPISSLKKYPYKDIYYSDIEMPIIKDNGNETHDKIQRLLWIRKNAKIIDVLHLYFFDRWTWIYLSEYKRLNKDGLVYVHIDTDGQRLLKYKFPNNPLKKFLIKHVLLKDENLNSTLWGIQNERNAKLLEGKWPFKNIKFVPNGVYWENDIQVKIEEKKKIILTVARNGSPGKNTDLLLNSFASIANMFPEWRLRLIGTIEDSFKPFVKEYYKKYPELKGRVEFVGPIYDRNLLQREYVAAKIFCFPSAYESFGLVAAEALSKGCCIVGSDIPSNIQVTNNGEYGVLFKNGNLNDFHDKLCEILSDEERMNMIARNGIEYARKYYSWSNIVKIIDDWIKENRSRQLYN